MRQMFVQPAHAGLHWDTLSDYSLGDAPSTSVTSFTATIPVLESAAGSDYGATILTGLLNGGGGGASGTAYGKVYPPTDWYAVVHPNFAQTNIQVTIQRKDHGPFDESDAAAAINTAANANSTKLAAFEEWVVTTVANTEETAADLTPSAILQTAYQQDSAAADSFIDNVRKNGLTDALGLPSWTPYAVGGVVALVVLVQLARVKSTFLGGGR